MKTLDEAIRTFVTVERTTPEEYVERTIKGHEAQGAQREALDRYEDIGNEIVANPMVSHLVAQLFIRAASGSLQLNIALLDAFIYGVMVGMEMEKPK